MKYFIILLMGPLLVACSNPIYITTSTVEESIAPTKHDEELHPLDSHLQPIALPPLIVIPQPKPAPVMVATPTPVLLPPAPPATPPPTLLTIKRDIPSSSLFQKHIPIESPHISHVPKIHHRAIAPTTIKRPSPPPHRTPVLLAQVIDIPPPEEKPKKTITPPQALDIMFVFDTSDSMYVNLISYREKFRHFWSILKPFKWQWAITNADYGDTAFALFDLGALKGEFMPLEEDGVILDRRILTAEVPNYENIFLDTISIHKPYQYENEWSEALEDQFVEPCDLPPGCQSYQEQPLKTSKFALSKNKDFFRDNADLAVVIATNSQERAGDPSSATQPEEVIQQFHAIHGTQKKFKVYGIIIAENDTECIRFNKESQWFFPEGSYSEKVAQLAYKTGGQIFNICATDYKDLALTIYNDFMLPSQDQ